MPPSVGPASIRNQVSSASELRARIEAGKQQCADAGYAIETRQFAPDKDKLDAAVDECREILGARKWDGLVVGFGIRGVPEFTGFFEKVVNVAREIVPGTPLGFNTRPDDLLETVLRAF